ncbi:MAG: 50S ribosomal protein L25/general stress protein Ctc [Chlorobi bacterium]|nr:50S ribosomal protein L25/general stress protein Ctc [Chlorobiota bacterium]
MKKVSLSGSPRENVGKKDAKKQRREGKIPCVIYGGKEQVHFSVEELNFDSLIFTPEVYEINLEVDGKQYSAVLQDVQYHPVTDKVLHADFLEVVEGKPIIVGIPVRLVGDSPGVIRGGKLIHKMHRLRIKGLINQIPEFVEVDISGMDIGGSVKVREIELENMSFLDPLNSVIVRVKAARNVEEEVEEEEEEETGEAEEAAPAPDAE